MGRFIAENHYGIQEALASIPKQVTTDERSTVCPACSGLTFVWRGDGFDRRAVRCSACKPKPRADK